MFHFAFLYRRIGCLLLLSTVSSQFVWGQNTKSQGYFLDQPRSILQVPDKFERPSIGDNRLSSRQNAATFRKTRVGTASESSRSTGSGSVQPESTPASGPELLAARPTRGWNARQVEEAKEPAQQNYTPLSELGFRPIQELSSDSQARDQEAVPEDYAARLLADEPRIEYLSEPSRYAFVQNQIPASDFAYQPLYFEELNLERHGKHRPLIQPLISGARFVGTVPLLPYKLTRQPPRSHVRTTDPYPSGLPAPWVRERGSFSRTGLRNELLAIAIAVLVIP